MAYLGRDVFDGEGDEEEAEKEGQPLHPKQRPFRKDRLPRA